MLQVNFKAYGSYVTDSLYQWDKNQQLNIVGLNLASAPEVHFANANMDRAIVRQSKLENDVISVTIPNSLLQVALPIKAYVGVYEGETFKIIESLKIPVIAKERPTDYVFEDDGGEVYSYNEILNKVIQMENKIGDVNFNVLKEYNDWVARIENTYTKEESLSDDTRALCGLESGSVPDDALNVLAQSMHRIFVGSYPGNGDFGADKPTTITVGFQPKIVFLIGKDLEQTIFSPFIFGSDVANCEFGGSNTNHTISLTWGDKSVSFYNTEYASAQGNSDGVTYHYVAIG